MPAQHRGGAEGSGCDLSRRGPRSLHPSPRRRFSTVLAGVEAGVRRRAAGGNNDRRRADRSANQGGDRSDGAPANGGMMRAMRRVLGLVVLLLAAPSSAFATWSVIAVDRSTGRVVIASATCVDQNDEFLKGVQAVVVPGKGVAACQAGVDNTHQSQMLVFRELQKGTEPKAIIEQLSADPAFQTRQFGIVDLQG